MLVTLILTIIMEVCDSRHNKNSINDTMELLSFQSMSLKLTPLIVFIKMQENI